jgi:uncharacterized protein YkwD
MSTTLRSPAFAAIASSTTTATTLRRMALATAGAAALWCGAAAAHRPDPCASFSSAATLQHVAAKRAVGAPCGERGHFAPAPATARLAWSPVLERVAREQVAWLVDFGLLVHTGRDGETISQRAQAAGYRFARIAENLAHGQADVADVLDAWQASAGHCVNLFDPQVTEMALACAPAPDGRAMWVLVLGRQLEAEPAAARRGR